MIKKSLPAIAFLACSTATLAANLGEAFTPSRDAYLQEPPPPPMRKVPVPPPRAQSAPEPALKINQARGAVPRNQERWMARILQNYPSRARREGIEGTVGISMRVTPHGRGTSCRATSSSGSDMLDSAACRAAERFARFEPALDAAGRPTTGSFRTRISYQLPEGVSQDEPNASFDPSTASPSLEFYSPGAPDVSGEKMAMTARDAALYWLDEANTFTIARTGGQSAAIMRGFVDTRELNDQMIAALNEGSIKPSLILTNPSTTAQEPIRVIRSRIQAGIPEHCGLLVQLFRSKDDEKLNENVASLVDGAPYYAPSFALSEDCEINKPHSPATKPGELFNWDGDIAFVAAGGAVRVDESVFCEDFDDITDVPRQHSIDRLAA